MTSVNRDGATEAVDGLPILARAEAGLGSRVGEEDAVDPHAEERSLWSEYEAHVVALRYDQAKAALDELYRRNWRRHQVCLALARVAGATRQHEQAVGYFDEAAETAPLNASHRISLAKHLTVTGDLDRALALLEEAKAKSTGMALVRCLLAAYAIHYETRRWAEAETVWGRFSPSSPRTRRHCSAWWRSPAGDTTTARSSIVRRVHWRSCPATPVSWRSAKMRDCRIRPAAPFPAKSRAS